MIGRYFRKSGEYDPSNGWQRKWTYKLGWVGSGSNPRLVAMTDGMIIKPGHLQNWVQDNDMVEMTRLEVISFIVHDGSNF